MKIDKILNTAVFCAALLFINCGNSSEVDSAPGTIDKYKTVRGNIYNLDGVPVHGAIVNVRRQNTLADTSGILLKIKTSTLASTSTDNEGTFAFNSIKSGLYTIECCDGINISIYQWVTVEESDITVSLPPDTLKPAGAIKGVVRLAAEGDPAKSLVLAFGVDRFARVESDGSFIFMGLAEGAYDLRIISSLKNYIALDISDIKVISRGTTSLNTLMLPCTGF